MNQTKKSSRGVVRKGLSSDQTECATVNDPEEENDSDELSKMNAVDLDKGLATEDYDCTATTTKTEMLKSSSENLDKEGSYCEESMLNGSTEGEGKVELAEVLDECSNDQTIREDCEEDRKSESRHCVTNDAEEESFHLFLEDSYKTVDNTNEENQFDSFYSVENSIRPEQSDDESEEPSCDDQGEASPDGGAEVVVASEVGGDDQTEIMTLATEKEEERIDAKEIVDHQSDGDIDDTFNYCHDKEVTVNKKDSEGLSEEGKIMGAPNDDEENEPTIGSENQGETAVEDEMIGPIGSSDDRVDENNPLEEIAESESVTRSIAKLILNRVTETISETSENFQIEPRNEKREDCPFAIVQGLVEEVLCNVVNRDEAEASGQCREKDLDVNIPSSALKSGDKCQIESESAQPPDDDSFRLVIDESMETCNSIESATQGFGKSIDDLCSVYGVQLCDGHSQATEGNTETVMPSTNEPLNETVKTSQTSQQNIEIVLPSEELDHVKTATATVNEDAETVTPATKNVRKKGESAETVMPTEGNIELGMEPTEEPEPNVQSLMPTLEESKGKTVMSPIDEPGENSKTVAAVPEVEVSTPLNAFTASPTVEESNGNVENTMTSTDVECENSESHVLSSELVEEILTAVIYSSFTVGHSLSSPLNGCCDDMKKYFEEDSPSVFEDFSLRLEDESRMDLSIAGACETSTKHFEHQDSCPNLVAERDETKADGDQEAKFELGEETTKSVEIKTNSDVTEHENVAGSDDDADSSGLIVQKCLKVRVSTKDDVQSILFKTAEALKGLAKFATNIHDESVDTINESVDDANETIDDVVSNVDVDDNDASAKHNDSSFDVDVVVVDETDISLIDRSLCAADVPAVPNNTIIDETLGELYKDQVDEERVPPKIERPNTKCPKDINADVAEGGVCERTKLASEAVTNEVETNQRPQIKVPRQKDSGDFRRPTPTKISYNEEKAAEADETTNFRPNETPLSGKEKQMIEQKSPGLRLRNVETLMAVSPEVFQQQNESRILSPTWHVAQGFSAQHPSEPNHQEERQSQEVQNRIVVSFDHVETEFGLTYFITSPNSTSETQKRYHIFTSTSALFMKLFVSKKVVETLPKSVADWMSVNVWFWPNETKPTHIRLRFETGNKKEIIAKLPADHLMTQTLLEEDAPFFGLSVFRIRDLNLTFQKQNFRPFITHAVNSSDRSVMAINLDLKKKPFAVPLFAFLEVATSIDEQVRRVATSQIDLAFRHDGVTRVDADTLEAIIFAKSNNNLSTYRQLIVKAVQLEVIEKKKLQRSPPLQPQQQAEPESVMASPSRFKCKLCEFVASAKPVFIDHLFDAHFSTQMSQAVSKIAPWQCQCEGCNIGKFEHRYQLIYHHAVDHENVEQVYNQVIEALQPFVAVSGDVQIEKCPVQNCHGKSEMKLADFLSHLALGHFKNDLLKEIRNLQTLLTIESTHCPIDDCSVTVYVEETMVKHVGVDHLRVVGLINTDQLGLQKDLFSAYKKVLSIEDVMCSVGENNKPTCSKDLGSKTGWLFHLSTAHYFKKLLSLFKAHSTESLQPDKRICPYCSQPFEVKIGAVHMGTAHKVANLIYEAAKKLSKTSSTCGVKVEVNRKFVLNEKKVDEAASDVTEKSRPTNDAPKLKNLAPNGKENRSYKPKPKSVRDGEERMKSLLAETVQPTPEIVKPERQPPTVEPELDLLIEADKLVTRVADVTVADGDLSQDDTVTSEHSPPVSVTPTSKLETSKTQSNHSESEMKEISTKQTASTSPPKTFEERKMDRPEEKDAMGQLIFKEYIKFCKNRKLNSEKCDITWVHIFLTSGRFTDHEHLLEAIALISKHHRKLPNGDLIDRHRLIENFKSKLTTKRKSEQTKIEKKSENLISENLDEAKNIFVCHPCGKKFESSNDLCSHVKAADHDENKIGCEFCEAVSTIEKEQISNDLASRLDLHVNERAHLHNRWLHLNHKHKKMDKNLRKTHLNAILEPGHVTCFVCSKDFNNLKVHLKTRQHQNNVIIIDNFVTYCNRRDISPVDCSIDDVIFYFDNVFPKTKRNKPKFNIHQILIVLARIHDPVGGMDIKADEKIDNHFKNLLTANSSMTVQPFVCFACPIQENDFEKFSEHCVGRSHQKALSERRRPTLADNVLHCEPCDIPLSNLAHLELHFFSKTHQASSWMLRTNAAKDQALVPNRDSTFFCQLCGEKFTALKEAEPHLKSASHRKVAAFADNYLSLCMEMNLNPVSCSKKELEEVLNKISKKSLALLQVIDKIHDPIDGQQVFDVFERMLEEARRKSKSEKMDHIEPDLAAPSRKRKMSDDASVNETLPEKTRKMSTNVIASKVCVDPSRDIKLKAHPKVVVSPKDRKAADSIFDRKDIPVVIFPDKVESYFWSVHKVEDSMVDLKPLRSECSGKSKSKKSSQVRCDKPTPFFRYEPKKLHKCGETETEAMRERDSEHTSLVLGCNTKSKPHSTTKGIRSKLLQTEEKMAKAELEEPPREIKISDKQKVIIEEGETDSEMSERKGRKRARDDEIQRPVEKKKKLSRTNDRSQDKKEVQTDIRVYAKVETMKQPKKEKLNSRCGQADIRSLVVENSDCQPNDQATKGVKRQADDEGSTHQHKKPRYSSMVTETSFDNDRVLAEQFPRSIMEPSSKQVQRSSSRPSSKSLKSPVSPGEASAVSRPWAKPKSSQSKNNGQQTLNEGNVLKKTNFEKSEQMSKTQNLSESFFRGNEGFCLDCDGCSSDCNHRNHARILFRDLNIHQRIYKKHVRLQTVGQFVDVNLRVSVEDLAWSHSYGGRVRKLFKKYAKTAEDVLWSYSELKECRTPKCSFSTLSVIDMFKHIQEHLEGGN